MHSVCGFPGMTWCVLVLWIQWLSTFLLAEHDTRGPLPVVPDPGLSLATVRLVQRLAPQGSRQMHSQILALSVGNATPLWWAFPQ